MLRVSSQTIHDIMFPDGRLRQTFFLFLFFYSAFEFKIWPFHFSRPLSFKRWIPLYLPFEQLQGSRCTFWFQIEAGKIFKKKLSAKLHLKQTVFLGWWKELLSFGCFFFRSDKGCKEKKFFNLTWKFLAFSKSATLLNLFFHPLLQPRESFILSCLNSFLSPYDELRNLKFLGCISNDV